MLWPVAVNTGKGGKTEMTLNHNLSLAPLVNRFSQPADGSAGGRKILMGSRFGWAAEKPMILTSITLNEQQVQGQINHFFTKNRTQRSCLSIIIDKKIKF
jgi:hypothetical protein